MGIKKKRRQMKLATGEWKIKSREQTAGGKLENELTSAITLMVMVKYECETW